jgi:hypothetical protein
MQVFMAGGTSDAVAKALDFALRPCPQVACQVRKHAHLKIRGIIAPNGRSQAGKI